MASCLAKFLRFMSQKLNFILTIVFVMLLGLSLVYTYGFVFKALIENPPKQGDTVFPDRDLYKYYQSEIKTRKDILDGLLSKDYKNIFK